MPRKRKGEIRESLAELSELEQRHRNNPSAGARLRMLRLLHEHPEMELAEVARGVNYSQQTVKRWLKIYRESGIDGLLKMRSVEGGGQNNGDELEALRAGIANGKIATREDVMAWLGENGMRGEKISEASRSSVVRMENSLHKSNPLRPSDGNEGDSEMGNMIDFLNALPSTHDMMEWINTFRTSLKEFLSDVCRVSVAVNMYCELIQPEHYTPGLVFSQNLIYGEKYFYEIDPEILGHEHIDRFLMSLRKTDFPFAEYHKPHGFVYNFGGNAYLGAIIVWRQLDKAPISQKTLRMMEKLYPFFVFLLSDLVVRYKNANPVDHPFNDLLNRMVDEAGLTKQERKIVILQLLGLSYDEMADTLHISPNTLRYHLRSIYRKTETHSHGELFARYFASRNIKMDKSHP